MTDDEESVEEAEAPSVIHTKSTKAPGPLRQFWWDTLPKNSPDWLVPPKSGLNPPAVDVAWITKEIAEEPEALEQTRRAHDIERTLVAQVESKAASMATLCLTLLATALAIAGYQFGYIRRDGHVSWLLLLPGVLSVCCIAMAVITSLEVQRVGIFQWEGAEPLGRDPGGRLGLVQAEETGRRYAAWTGKTKANGLLQARAWLSRALIALIVSAVIAIGLATRSPADTKKPSTATTTTTTSGTTTITSAASVVMPSPTIYDPVVDVVEVCESIQSVEIGKAV